MQRAQEEKGHTKVNNILMKIGAVLEVIIAIVLVLAIIVSIVPVLKSVVKLYGEGGNLDSFSTILNQLFTLIIGIEFLKMICRYNVDSVIEVILFALARQLVVIHSTPLENLLTIVSIAILFVIRKYLFIKQVDEIGNHHRVLEIHKPEEKQKKETKE